MATRDAAKTARTTSRPRRSRARDAWRRLRSGNARTVSLPSGALPWSGYRYEWLVIALVAVAALPVVNVVNAQDVSRLGLTRNFAQHASLELDAYAAKRLDRARYRGRWYTDKAPGLSFAALVPYALFAATTGAKPEARWEHEGDVQLWLFRVLTSGVAFVACVFLVGRVAEGLAAGTGAAVAATFGAGTLAAPLAATLFDHDAAALCGFAAFVLAWRARSRRNARWAAVGAGAVAGVGVLVEYQVAAVALVIALYLLAVGGLRPTLWFAAGLAPALIVLGVYDQLAFGSPFHLSYRYVANRFASEQQRGLFGIATPRLDAIRLVLVGARGLLVFSPVLVAAAAGLAALWRRHRAEAAVCVAVVGVFLLWNIGYFLPYGGKSPGPRFFAPALPFLALGLAYAFRRFPLPTAALALASVLLITLDTLTWALRPDESHTYVDFAPSLRLAKTLWVWAGIDRIRAATVCGVAACAALAVGFLRVRATRRTAPVKAS